jgi:hypothetical protein
LLRLGAFIVVAVSYKDACISATSAPKTFQGFRCQKGPVDSYRL